jgi:hypothetical protein
MRKGRECRGKLNDWVSRSKEEKACLMGERCARRGEVSVLKESVLLQHILDARAWERRSKRD